MGVPLNNEFLSLSDLLGPSSMFFGSRGVQRLAVVSDLILLLSWKKATVFDSFSLCYDFDTKTSIDSQVILVFKCSSSWFQGQLRMPIARYCLSVELSSSKKQFRFLVRS
jgi:hypothetical protein